MSDKINNNISVGIIIAISVVSLIMAFAIKEAQSSTKERPEIISDRLSDTKGNPAYLTAGISFELGVDSETKTKVKFKTGKDTERPATKKQECFAVVNVKKTDVLNMRKAPSPQGIKVTQIPYDGKNLFSLHENRAGWQKVRYMDSIGWVNGAYLKRVNDCTTFRPSCFNVIKVKKTDVLNMRKIPSPQGIKITQIPYDGKNILSLDEECILGNDAVWRKVQYENHEGWVNTHYLQPMNNCDK